MQHKFSNSCANACETYLQIADMMTVPIPISAAMNLIMPMQGRGRSGKFYARFGGTHSIFA